MGVLKDCSRRITDPYHAYQVLIEAIEKAPAENLHNVLEDLKELQGKITNTYYYNYHSYYNNSYNHYYYYEKNISYYYYYYKDNNTDYYRNTDKNDAYQVLLKAVKKVPAENLYKVLEASKNLIKSTPHKAILTLKNEVKSRLQGQEFYLQECLDILEGKSLENPNIGKHVKKCNRK